MSKLTIAEWPSAEIWAPLPAAYGLSTLATTPRADTLRTTSSTAARNAGLLAVSDSLSTSTVSPAGCSNPSSRIRAAFPDSPGSVSLSPSCLVPIAPPITTAATTNASQPKIAVLRWRALQRPMRAAMLLLRFRGDMGISRCGWVGVSRLSPRRAKRGRDDWCPAVWPPTPREYGCRQARLVATRGAGARGADAGEATSTRAASQPMTTTSPPRAASTKKWLPVATMIRSIAAG